MQIRFTKSLALTTLLLAGHVAQATIITGSIPGGINPQFGNNSYPYGNLDQHNTGCTAGGVNGCGPTAATNSFVMLQNLYPGIYDKNLVPYAGAQPTQPEMATSRPRDGGEGSAQGECRRAAGGHGVGPVVDWRVRAMAQGQEAARDLPGPLGKPDRLRP